jgi:choline kinase
MVGGCTLLDRQIRTLQSCGVELITVVAGHMAEDVARAGLPGAAVLHNPHFTSTDSLYSLWLARDQLLNGFVVLNGDVLFSPQMLSDLLAAPHEDALLVSARMPGTVYSDEETKVHIRNGGVADIGKTLGRDKSDAENVGIAKFGSSGARHLVGQLDRIVLSGAVTDSLPRAFRDFIRRRPLHVIEGQRYPWIEIDFPEDYQRACGEIVRAIESQ